MIELRFKEALDRYVKTGRPTGGFLQSVLENDLVSTIGKADLNAMANLKDIVSYCYNELPSMCWGSKEKVKNWFAKFHQIAEP
jgi:hypothetical protein